MFQNEHNCLTQVRQTFFVSFALTIRTRYFGTVGHKPWPILLDDYGEIVLAVTRATMRSGPSIMPSPLRLPVRASWFQSQLASNTKS
jgi:hypothetical protein